ncbi:glutamine synthetase family protein [Chromohalobacter sp. TMW 2.2299]|nr:MULTISPECIES: glutamine synthetase family protein [Chromohalobacter]MCK2044655.1 glutamine synthetase family protein [Chromohalobacter moromii]MCT8504191.1 glutamine synthetase family protein [Chromohalobacter moromii]MDO0944608.1 glutamine synthetase family protein [Chromohalobacter salexigens]NQY44812.1 glutamine synthetase [Chromohalobacter sp.]NWO55050.1 glutamine synthetase [Chromohalobacter salexigens]
MTTDKKQGKSRELDLFITDLNGNLRGKRLPASGLKKLRKEGLKLPLSVVGFDFWGADVLDNGLVFETGDSDGVCMPVSQEPIPVPWSEAPRDQMLAMMFNPDGTPFGADPRQVLNRMVDRFSAKGLTPVLATELEFYLMDAESESVQRPIPPALADGKGRRLANAEGYSVEEMDGFEAFFADIREACQGQGIGADTIIAEMGPGQFEVNLNHVADPLNAGDQAILFKRLVRGVSRRHGYAATFMAKPYVEESGNGFHTHFSLLDRDGNNVFDDGTEQGSDLLRHAIAGMMQLMPESMLVFAPHLNSYRRFMPGAHAPTHASWGYENRTVALRVPESPNLARRIEHRVAGADANPYLVLASILAGALHGMENALEPDAPVEGDAYAEESPRYPLPCEWQDAIARFEQSEILREYLGEEFVRVYAQAKRQERRRLNERISDVEYEAYLGLL